MCKNFQSVQHEEKDYLIKETVFNEKSPSPERRADINLRTNQANEKNYELFRDKGESRVAQELLGVMAVLNCVRHQSSTLHAYYP